MGMIVATFLLLMEEEDAFWMMVAVVEDLLPASYYSPSLIGVQADQVCMLIQGNASSSRWSTPIMRVLARLKSSIKCCWIKRVWGRPMLKSNCLIPMAIGKYIIYLV